MKRLPALLPRSLVVFTTVCLAAPLKVVAQPAEVVSISDAYKRMMDLPGDADAAMQYARLAVAGGQRRAAISVLERLLRLHPDLDSARLQLAQLYYTNNSPDLAAAYAEQALKAPSIPAPVAAQAQSLAAAANDAAKPSHLSVAISTGIRYDSDANQATALNTVTAASSLLGTVEIPTPTRAQSDWSAVTNVQVAHSYDLGLQRFANWETNFSLFDQRFFHINSAYDLDVVGFDTGPRVSVGSLGIARFSVRPFVSVSWLGYREQTYATLYGGGVSLGMALKDSVSFDLASIIRQGDYSNSNFRPISSLYTGAEESVSLTAAYTPTRTTRIALTASYYHASATAAYNARSGPGAAVAALTAFEVAGRPVSLSGRLGLQHLAYKTPNPFIDAGRSRTDTILDAGLAASVPLVGPLSAFVQYGYSHFASRYRIYRFDNDTLTIGLRADL